jgi:hypothetical protein
LASGPESLEEGSGKLCASSESRNPLAEAIEAETRPAPPELPPFRTASITAIEAATSAAPPSSPTKRARFVRKATGAE